MEALRHMATRDEPRPTQREWSPSGSLDPVSISRTHKRIDFMGGIRGTAQLEKLVDSRQFAVGFSMRATRVDQLMAISDAGRSCRRRAPGSSRSCAAACSSTRSEPPAASTSRPRNTSQTRRT